MNTNESSELKREIVFGGISIIGGIMIGAEFSI